MEQVLDETTLVAQLADADTRRDAFSRMVVLYQRRIYGIIRKMVICHDDADDLTQEVFVKVWNNLEKFRAESGIFTWVYRIAVNESLGFLRKKRRFRIFGGDANETLAEMLPAEMQPDSTEIELKLQKAILTLPDKQRLVFHMKYYEDLSYEEMAVITETSVGSLKASYHHAVKKIEDYIVS